MSRTYLNVPLSCLNKFSFHSLKFVSKAQIHSCLLSSHSLADSSKLVGSALCLCMWDVEGSNT